MIFKVLKIFAYESIFVKGTKRYYPRIYYAIDDPNNLYLKKFNTPYGFLKFSKRQICDITGIDKQELQELINIFTYKPTPPPPLPKINNG